MPWDCAREQNRRGAGSLLGKARQRLSPCGHWEAPSTSGNRVEGRGGAGTPPAAAALVVWAGAHLAASPGVVLRKKPMNTLKK